MLGGRALADDKEIAREAYRQGSRQFEIGDFKSALASFKKAYLSYADPAFLFNIAQCERQLGDKAEALRTYRVFLRKSPDVDPTQRVEVEAIVAELQSALERERRNGPAPATATIKPAVIDTAAPTGPAPARRADEARTAVSLTAPAQREKPRSKKWVWGVVAGGLVVAAGAVTLGVVLGTRPAPVELVYK
jgi:tetratricopeptide (TPR) repeat protein